MALAKEVPPLEVCPSLPVTLAQRQAASRCQLVTQWQAVVLKYRSLLVLLRAKLAVA